MLRKTVRQRRDYLYRKAMILKEAEINEKRAKLRNAIAQGRPLEKSIASDKALRKDFAYDESRPDLNADEQLDLDDEYAQLSGLVDPRVLVTTSRSSSTRLTAFSKEMRLLLPTSIRLNRGNMILDDCDLCMLFPPNYLMYEDLTDNGRSISHLPHGPTVSFSLHNVLMRGDIPGSIRGSVSEAYPHLIFEGFTSRLGNRICKVLKHLFPPRDPITSKTKLSNRVVVFKNIEDVIELRHYVYVKTAYDKVELSEVGPRMSMKLFEVRNGTLENKDGHVEWHLNQFTRTSRKKDYL
ncbi:u3 small nucleolar ribonucleoprotein protein imp4 [Grosmannia clavigera kw1407]|uniref:U3 small nucleolar ribonucleoprotein protein IMP4 n=1 Tax=Grosmannia clavigera (strain kw1407 / UAMH 11150) TaxID=655863 RepID=F0XFN0_GROCL|nr:u3 small nucleolar ribonucleoprotein imp4 [Grosmannia clavigera kw1407]EFX04349.1 u3 small nucleolar ribonucleoprotein protein imp4 [Grosmannia clavigera kw1407]